MRIPLAAGDLGDIFMLLKMINKLFDETFLPQKGLAPHLGPDGLLSDAPADELSVFLFRLSAFSAELAAPSRSSGTDGAVPSPQ